jgi:hypothetical protein
MKKISLLIIFTCVTLTHSFSQPLWKISSPDAYSLYSVGGDTSIAHLKAILNDETWTRHEFLNYYESAARLLAFYAGQTEKNFILSKLRIFANFNSPDFSWDNYYTYQQIRGWLGDSGAIAGMDSVVQFALDDLDLRLNAISHLAEAGRFEYFDVVRQAFISGNILKDGIFELGEYGQDPRYRVEAGNLLAGVVSTSNDRLKIASASRSLAEFDKPRAVQLLESRFRSTTGELRSNFADDLSHIDRDGDPERTIYAVPLEPDEYIRSRYLPMYSFIINHICTKRYLLPFYVKFTKDRLSIESSQIVSWYLRNFLKDFIPLKPADSLSTLNMIDTLIDIKNQVAGYNWVGNAAFVTELSNHLTSARSYLVGGDSLNCTHQVFTFQQKVDEEYRDSLDGDARYVNREGWKFLYYNAKYILDRMPGMATLGIPVNRRWNMVSVPVVVSDFYKSSIYPSATAPVYTYQHGYVTKDTLANGVGYWVKFGSDQYINYTGSRIDTISVPVVAGWNMIGSLSYDIPTTQIQAVGTNVTSSYLTYDSGGYSPKNIISAGKGYWIKVSGSGTLLLGGLSSSGGQLPAPEPPPAPGAPSTPSLSSPSDGATGQSRTPILSWSASNGATSYRLQVSTSSSFSTLIVDDATITTTSKQIGTLSYSTMYYWRVKAVNSNGSSYWSEIWSFTTVGTTPPNPCDPISTMSALDQFSVTDADGNTQHLYARQKGRKLALGHNNDEMPPEPMEGIFSVRFQSGKMIESITHGQGKKKIPIKVRDAVYPITIRWNIKTENKMKYWLTKPGKNQEEIELNNAGSMILESTDAGVIVIQSQVIEPVPCEEEQGME